MQEVREVWKEDPGASKKSLFKRAKAQVAVHDAQRRLDHTRSLQHQGQLLRATKSKAAGMWSSVVLQLPPQVLKFSANATQDTLPQNTNQPGTVEEERGTL